MIFMSTSASLGGNVQHRFSLLLFCLFGSVFFLSKIPIITSVRIIPWLICSPNDSADYHAISDVSFPLDICGLLPLSPLLCLPSVSVLKWNVSYLFRTPESTQGKNVLFHEHVMRGIKDFHRMLRNQSMVDGDERRPCLKA